MPQLWTLDTTTGAGSPVGPLGLDATMQDVSGIAFSPAGTLYGWTESNPDTLITIDTTTGAATVVGSLSPNSTRILGGLDFDPDSGVLYWNDGVSLHTVDPATAATQLVGTTGGSISMSAIVFTSVPEPAATLLLAAGIGCLGASQRVRRRRPGRSRAPLECPIRMIM